MGISHNFPCSDTALKLLDDCLGFVWQGFASGGSTSRGGSVRRC